MKIFASLLSIGLVIAGTITLLWFFMPSFSKQFEPPKIIQVKAFLDNRCSVTNDAFVAEAPEQGRTAKFYDGVAIMRLPEDAKIQLAISKAFPDFKYDDVPQDVAGEVVLVADCSASPRIKSIFGAMNEQFKDK
ncbi:hypothetical protein N8977_04655 [Alphaproteobacteria bacterium]|nr:hypothetical protein [Alphaproteobacteria bacterium]